ncbi:hypothetical protein Gocc_2931 [Gaiella occulta]|uniref:Uncharacterized protein n=1 Tax=Gaiella occulta TaxID=1002870 RepID=A0A7M2YT41_9ACTN|nr:hypothetical protein [Gaiella occulta]RDI73331.1 hypothetical protein Gocc_2931 [Gaiella occulta]
MTGWDALAAVAALVLLAFTLAVAEWRSWDERRRSSRLVERTLWRMTGGRRL